jgi:hypothetical protein
VKTTALAVAALVAIAGLPFTAAAEELAPIQAGTYVLGNQTASVFYVEKGAEYEVVTTIAPNYGSGGVPVRFVGWLAPGQRQTVSCGQFETAAAPHELQISRIGDRLVAEIMPPVTVAVTQ